MEVRNIVQNEYIKCIAYLQAISGSSFSVEENINDSSKLNLYIYGEENTIHKEGIYKVEFTFTKDFPKEKPAVKFIQPLPYHCNIDEEGNICLDYYTNWNENTYQEKSLVILVENLCTFIHEQVPDNCLRWEIGTEQLTQKDVYITNVKDQAQFCRKAFIDG